MNPKVGHAAPLGQRLDQSPISILELRAGRECPMRSCSAVSVLPRTSAVVLRSSSRGPSESMRLDDAPDVLTVDELRSILRISRAGAYGLLRKGHIPAIRIGRRLLCPKRALMHYLEGCEPQRTSSNPVRSHQ